MKIRWYRMIGLSIGLTLGNFAFQAFSEHRWAVAVDRSFFQVVAIFAFILSFNLLKSNDK